MTNGQPPPITVDVGSIIFTSSQSLSDQQLVVGGCVDAMPWGVQSPGDYINQNHSVSISTPPLSQAAVFLQSYFVEFQISDFSAITRTPDFSYANIGASDVSYNSSTGTLDFTSSIYMFSAYPTEDAGWGDNGGAYALSTSANYIYVGILADT